MKNAMLDAERAVSCLKEGLNCSQAIVSTYSVRHDLKRELAIKISTAFGGGINLMGKTCGAVTGALMVIGLKYGRTKTPLMASEFIKKFKALNGSITCKDLLGFDISSGEGIEKVIENDFFYQICPNLVRSSANILEHILEEKSNYNII